MNKRNIISRSPLVIQILLTRACNINCIYCSAEEMRLKEKEPELNTNEWKKLIKRLKEIQLFSLSISGGEIFLRNDIFDILEFAVRSKFPKLRISTNGILIDEKVAHQLKELHINNVSVSLDGNKKTHDQIRGKGSFEKTLKGIKNLISNKITPSIRFTPLKSNYKYLSEIVDILDSFGIRRIVFNSLKASGRCKNIYKEIMMDYFVDIEELQKIIHNIRENYIDFKISDIDDFYRSLPVLSYKKRASLKNMNKKKIFSCSAAISSCNISSSGWVFPCSELFDFKGGNIRDRDILYIWNNSENFKKIRNLSHTSIDQVHYCRNCDYNVFCNGGCRANAYAVYGDLMAPDPFCPFWREI